MQDYWPMNILAALSMTTMEGQGDDGRENLAEITETMDLYLVQVGVVVIMGDGTVSITEEVQKNTGKMFTTRALVNHRGVLDKSQGVGKTV